MAQWPEDEAYLKKIELLLLLSAFRRSQMKVSHKNTKNFQCVTTD